ncbi:hypothetical protein BTE77_28300 [Ensifer adhaerens]|nr:hypothetical protein BTE77_28300 [Ensifer adhaerens]
MEGDPVFDDTPKDELRIAAFTGSRTEQTKRTNDLLVRIRRPPEGARLAHARNFILFIVQFLSLRATSVAITTRQIASRRAVSLYMNGTRNEWELELRLRNLPAVFRVHAAASASSKPRLWICYPTCRPGREA